MQRFETQPTEAYQTQIRHTPTARNKQDSKPFQWKLVPIFAIPLMLMLSGLQASKSYVDVFDEASLLPLRLEEAQKLGYPTSLKYLSTKPLMDKDNSYVEYQKMVNEGLIGELPLWRLANHRTDDLAKEPFLKELRIAQRIGKYSHTRLAGDDVQSFDQIGADSVIRLLQYSLELARHDRGREALETQKQAFNIYLQYTDDPRLFSNVDQGSFPTLIVSTCKELLKVFAGKPKLQAETFEFMREISRFSTDSALNQTFFDVMRYWEAADTDAVSIIDWRKRAKREHESYRGDEVHLPRTQFAQGMLSRSVDYFIQVRKAMRASIGTREVEQKLAKIDSEFKTRLTGKAFNDLQQMFAHDWFYIKRDRTEIAALIWASEIARDYGNQLPSQLPPRVDPGVGKTLKYIHSQGDWFTIQSDGLEWKYDHDNDGPRRINFYLRGNGLSYRTNRREIDLETCLFGGKRHITHEREEQRKRINAYLAAEKRKSK